MKNRRDKTGKKIEHPYLLPSKIKLRSTVYYNGLYSLTIKVNYQTNLTKTITMRVERKLTKTRSFVHKNKEQRILLQVKFSLCSEFSSL